jgi:hypothetical protein
VTKHGGEATVYAKTAAFLVVLALMMFLFYGADLTMGRVLFGPGDLSRPIQSIEGYLSSPFSLSVGGYLALFFLLQYLALFATGLVLIALYLFFRTVVITALTMLVTFFVELVLYTQISAHSVWAPLRQFNLVALLNTSDFFTRYQTMNFLGLPLESLWVGAAFGAFIIVVCVLIAPKLWRGSKRKTSLLPRPARRTTRSPVKVDTNLLGYELYKVFVSHRGILILSCFLVLQVCVYGHTDSTFDVDEMYYQQYSDILAGELTDEKQAYISQQQTWYEDLNAAQQEWYERAASGEVSDSYAEYRVSQLDEESAGETGFLRAAAQYESLCEAEASGVRYIPDTGYQALMGDPVSDAIDSGKLLCALILGLSAVFSIEQSSQVCVLIDTSIRGPKAVGYRKLVCGALYTCLAFMIAFLPRVLSVLSKDTLTDLFASAASLQQFKNAPTFVPILGWLLVILITRVVTFFLAAWLVMFLSHKTKHTVATILLAGTILLLPVATYLLGITKQWGLLPFMTGAGFYG